MNMWNVWGSLRELQFLQGISPTENVVNWRWGMALATKPAMLLLDEPMAGLGPGGTLKLCELIEELKGEVTILLVEHDTQAVFALADRISVLVQGEVVATDSPLLIKQNRLVQEAYLGGT